MLLPVPTKDWYFDSTDDSCTRRHGDRSYSLHWGSLRSLTPPHMPTIVVVDISQNVVINLQITIECLWYAQYFSRCWNLCTQFPREGLGTALLLRIFHYRERGIELVSLALVHENTCGYSETEYSWWEYYMFCKSVFIGHTSIAWSPYLVQIPPISSPTTLLMGSLKRWNGKDTVVPRPQLAKGPESFQTGFWFGVFGCCCFGVLLLLFKLWNIAYSIIMQKGEGGHPQM